jgi:hypothetical protein
MADAHDHIIRASEIGQYAFCAHAWWLGSVEGRPSANRQELTAGEAAHLRHGLGVKASLLLSRVAYAALALAVVVGLVWMVSLLVG